MIINSLKLENIRSYTSEIIKFPSGSVLLSGDIGCGKSTILSAIEFALFGVKRKDLSGISLLRHGKKEGSVELDFSIDDKSVIVKRNLKRGKDDVKQEAGYIIKDGLKKEATAVELKSAVLGLLGFPLDLVSKSKDLVYRYTVYTPQEQMKQILLGDVESRLDTLRRVFGIDKYKKIRNNSSIVSKFLREKINLNMGKISDLDEKQSLKMEQVGKIDLISKEVDELLPSLENIKKDLDLKKQEIASVEEGVKKLNNLKGELNVCNTNFNNFKSNLERNSLEVKNLNSEIEIIKAEVQGKETLDVEVLKKDIEKRNEEILGIEKKINELNSSVASLESKKQISENLKQKVVNIDQCPTCLQQVCDEHKMFISSTEDETIVYVNKDINLKSKEKESLVEEIGLLKVGLEKIKKKESEISLIKLKLVHVEEKGKRISLLQQENNNLNEKIVEIGNKVKLLEEGIGGLSGNEERFNLVKKEYDLLLGKERDFSIKQAELIKEKETISLLVGRLNEEIDSKLKTKEELKGLNEKHEWLTKHFVNLVINIEKHVMLRIHQEFSELFKEWFNLLIEDDTITARLDDSFTPIIEQDGYDTEYINLSGGEKTSLALAYRLSLNKVINDLITTIKMNDLIILDEPTDGFSTEQLDRVKVVIDQLDLNQMIIVSHESKIEGFVDNVLRIVKQDSVSKISV
jgi:DNA repair protein SbcC/Rad50